MAAGSTYVFVGSATAAGGSTTQLVMSSIPSTYTDLILVINGAGAGGAGGNVWLQFNGDTDGAHYSSTRILGDGSAASSARQTSPGYFMIGDIGSGSKFSTVAHVMNYANTSTYKTVLSKHGAENVVGGYVGLWRGNTGSAAQAITSITVGFNSQNIASGTTFTLYGIAAA